MITADFIDSLHCPYCGGALEVERISHIVYEEILGGNVRCGCSRYSIINGILILRQFHEEVGKNFESSMSHVNASDSTESLRSAMGITYPQIVPQTRMERVLHQLEIRFGRRFSGHQNKRISKEVLADPGITFNGALERLRSDIYAEYLFHRYANPSFMASVAMIGILNELNNHPQRQARKPRVLDLGCGAGHATFLISQLFDNMSVVATDHDYINLYLARRYLAPRATYLCLDAEAPLPFMDNFCDAVFNVDMFHYLHAKSLVVTELDRVVQRMGLWLFAHLHNAHAENLTPGLPLSVTDYQRCFEPISGRLFSERGIIRRFIRSGCVDLSPGVDEEDLEDSPSLCMIAGRQEDLWRRHDDPVQLLCQEQSDLTLNPIYRQTKEDGFLNLDLEWPNNMFKAECDWIEKDLPLHFHVEEALLDRLRRGQLTAADQPQVEKLTNSFVLVHLPQGYAES